MSSDRKEEIIEAALGLASERGLGNVSMAMIAERVGIRKPSLYNHFSSKDELVEEMYRFLRERARVMMQAADMTDPAALFGGQTPAQILRRAVDGYIRMSLTEDMRAFYRVIYSERVIQPMAARIMAEETERMILATRRMLYAMEVHGLLHFRDADMSAVSFAMTVHGLMEHALDRDPASPRFDDIYAYIDWFCAENAREGDTK